MSSGAFGEGDAGDAGVVVEEADVVPGGQELGEGVALAESELKREQAVFAQGFVGGGDEASVDVEALGAGEESGVGFVVDDFALHGGGVACGDVGRVGDDGVEGFGGGVEACEQIGLQENDAVGAVVGESVFLRDGEGGLAGIDGDDGGGGEVGSEGDGDGSGAGADVGEVQRVGGGLRGGPKEDLLDEEFGFGPRDEDGGGDAEGEAVELLRAGEVLQGFSGGAAGGEGGEKSDLRGV